MWASSSCLLLAAAQRDLFQAPLNPGFLAPAVSSSAYAPSFQTINEPASYIEVQSAAYEAPTSSSTAVLATVSVVAMFAVAGYTLGQRSGALPAPAARASSAAPVRARVPEPVSAGAAAALSEAMSEVQGIIAEMASSPEAMQKSLSTSARVQELAAQKPAMAAALKDPAALQKQQQIFDAMHQMLGGLKEALADPAKQQRAAERLQTLSARARTSRAGVPAMQLSQLSETNKKILSFDRDGVFEAREISDKKPPVKLLNRVNELRVLTSLADAGLLSKAEEAGVFSKLEKAGAFSAAEKLLPLLDDLKVLSLAEDLLNIPANVQVLAAVALLGGEFGIISLVPDDNAALIAVQVITGLLAGGGAVTLLASAFLFSLLQGEN